MELQIKLEEDRGEEEEEEEAEMAVAEAAAIEAAKSPGLFMVDYKQSDSKNCGEINVLILDGNLEEHWVSDCFYLYTV